MATTLEIETKINTTDAVTAIQKLEDRIKKLEKIQEDSVKQQKNMAKAVKATEKNTGALAKGFKGVGLAIKAAGIGLVIGVLNEIKNLFMQNQKVADLFSTAFNALSKVVNDFVDFISSGKALDSVVNFFKNFEFSAFYIAKTAAEIATYAELTLDAAAAQTELANSAILAEARLRKSIEEFDRQAEILRQRRDDDTLSIKDRIKANEDLIDLLAKQQEQELELAQMSIDAAAAASEANKDNVQLQADLITAESEYAAVKARVTGQVSEALINRNSLQREQNELLKENIRIQTEQLDKIGSRGATDIERDPEVVKARKAAKVKLGINADLNKNLARQTDTRTKFETELEEKKVAIARNAANALMGLMEEGSAEAKAIASAQVLFDTFRGIQAAFASNAANAGATVVTGGAWPFIQAASAAAFGFANLAAIHAAPIKGGSGGGGSAPSVSAPTAPSDDFQAPEFGFLNQGVGGTQGADFGASRSYVVLQDIRDKESLDERIRDSSRLG